MRRKGSLATLSLLAAGLSCLTATGAPFEVVTGGKGQCVIVQKDASSKPLCLAASELQKWVGALTGATLDIVASKPDGGRGIVLEVSDSVAELRGNDGYAVRRGDGEFSIVGSCPKGVLNGVFKVLYSNTDIIWARPDEAIGTVCRHRDDLSFAEESKTEVPVYRQRGWQMESPTEREQNAFWLTHNCSNWMTNRALAPEHGCILEFGGGHNLNGLYITEALYFDKHPEFFPLIDGVRLRPSATTARSQLCFTNDEMTAEFIKRLDMFVQKNPNFQVYRVMLEDNYSLCTCDKCMEPIVLPDGTVLDGRQIKKKDGKGKITKEWKVWRSTQFFLWYNKLAAFMKEKYPDKRLLSFAYFFTEFAPKIPVMDNVDISFCPIYRDSKFTVTAPQNQEVLDTVNEWLKMTSHVTWREYYGLNVEFPRPIDRMAFADMSALAGKGICKTYSELVADCKTRHRWRGDKIWDLSAPYLWSLVQAPWNPYRKVEDVRKEYFERVFGKAAAPHMERFYSLIEEQWYANPRKSVWNDPSTVLWKLHFVATGIEGACREQLNQALPLADTANGKAMVQRILDYFDGKVDEKPEGLRIPKAVGAVSFVPGFEDVVWSKALTIDKLYDDALKPCPHPTTIRVLHDGTNLYVAMHAERKGIDTMMDATKKYCHGETLDVFFGDGVGMLADYVHVMVDPLGRIYASASSNQPVPKFKWKHESTFGKDSWDAMVTVPLTEVPDVHRMTIFRRYNKHGKPGIWPSRGAGVKGTTMHQPVTFAPFVLE